MLRLPLLTLFCALTMLLSAGNDLSSLPAPTVMAVREIRPPESLPGEVVPVDFPTSKSVSLFVPEGYHVPESGAVELTMHFHGAGWFAIQEHLRRGLDAPLLVFELGEGSTIYKTPFLDETRFLSTVHEVETLLKERSGNTETHVETVDISSFSAGYGAVREIIKSEENVKLIRRIVLGDSSYGSLEPEALEGGNRVVAAEHVEPWAAFARLAATGEKTLLMTTSKIAPETYAGTFEVARAVAEAVGAEVHPVEPNSDPSASTELEYPLAERADLGGFHWWSYNGEDAMAHMTLARHIAEDWIALDAAGNP